MVATHGILTWKHMQKVTTTFLKVCRTVRYVELVASTYTYLTFLVIFCMYKDTNGQIHVS